MVNFVFGVPWWAYVALAIVGAVIFWVGNKRQTEGVRMAGLVVALLGGLLVFAGFFVETDKQKCLRQSKEAARDVVEKKWADLTAMLDPHASLSVGGISLYANRDDLVKGAQDGVNQYGLKDVTVLSRTANQTETIVTVDMEVLTEQDATMGQPVRSSWEMEWQKEGGKWLLYRMTCVGIGDLDEGHLRGVFPR